MSSDRPSFEVFWQDMRPGLERALRGRGAAPDVVDDVLQETSIRLLKVWDRLDHDRALGPFVRTIAFNCLIDVYRANRLVPLEDLPDEPSTYDIEEHALARARLASAATAMDSLTSSDRSALLAEVGVGERATSSAAKMARLRARKRLMTVMDRVAAAFGTVQLNWRRAAIWFQDLKPAGEASLPVMAGVASVATAAVLGIAPDPSSLRLPNVHRLDHIRTVSQKRADQRDRRPDRESARRAVRIEEPRPRETVALAADRSPKPRPTPDEETVVDTGNAKARASEGEGYKRIEACTGRQTSDKEDDSSTSVTIDLGEGEDPGESCG